MPSNLVNFGSETAENGTETKNNEKLKQKPSRSEETVWTIVREGSPGGRSETTVGG